ncbi:MAG: DUF2442 domain-containing protein [Sulfurimonas sp.]|jgi:hypothetical protein|nr:DUF2442 domain-containing protein [Sulfurimonas sp.]
MNTLITKLEFNDRIYIYLDSKDVLTIPYDYTSKIKTASTEALKNYRLIGNGVGVHFEDIDEDISLRGIISYKILHELQAS